MQETRHATPFGSTLFAASAGLLGLLALSSCQPAGTDGTPEPTVLPATPLPTPEPTPTLEPTPTAAPTPYPIPEHLLVDSLVLTGGETGLDLTEDGVIDNHLEVALGVINQTLLDEVAKVLLICLPGMPCDLTTYAKVESLLNETLTLENLNQTLSVGLEASQPALYFDPPQAGTTELVWFTVDEGGAPHEGGRLAGTLTAGGEGDFGPAEVGIGIELEEGQGTVLVSFYETRLTFEGYDGAQLPDGVGGAAIRVNDLLKWCDELIVLVNQLMPRGADLDRPQTLDILEGALLEEADIDTDLVSTPDAYSLGVTLSATQP